MVGFLDPARQGLAAARLAYAADRPDADAPALAAAAAGDAALGFERARWLRRRDRDAEAAAAWASKRALPGGGAGGLAGAAAPGAQAAAAGRCEGGLCRLRPARHEQPGEARQEAEFLAGFIALRKLEDAAAAERHFTRLAEGSRSVITRARALYWQGRALAARGDAAAARQRYAAAAELPLAFYGQLAALALGEDGAALSARIARLPGPGGARAAGPGLRGQGTGTGGAGAGRDRRDPAGAAIPAAAGGSGAGCRPRRRWWRGSARGSAGRTTRSGWRGGPGRRGAMLLEDGWPAPYPAPAFGPEAALLNAITRQESNFDPEAVSSANARGLMQLLPGTAQQVARRIGAPYAVGLLTQDPGHNMRLGAAYLEQLIGRFGGALPCAIAGYNAGPGRVDEWLAPMATRGTGAVSMLDWMEQIPFGETRNYVQRVIENMAIYRARDAAAAAQEHPMAQWQATLTLRGSLRRDAGAASSPPWAASAWPGRRPAPGAPRWCCRWCCWGRWPASGWPGLLALAGLLGGAAGCRRRTARPIPAGW